MLFFSREATSEIYGTRVYFLIIYFQIYFSICLSVYLPLLFSNLYYQKPKNTSLNFICIYQSTTILSRPLDNFWHCYPKGINNPFNTSGCKYLFFVCRYHLHSVFWFSNQFDNLDLITEGNTYCCCAASSLPLWRNTAVVQANINEETE